MSAMSRTQNLSLLWTSSPLLGESGHDHLNLRVDNWPVSTPSKLYLVPRLPFWHRVVGVVKTSATPVRHESRVVSRRGRNWLKYGAQRQT